METEIVQKYKAQAIPKLRFREFDSIFQNKKINECIEFLTDYHANGSYKKLKENVDLLNNEDYAIMIRTTNLEKNNFCDNLLYINEHAYNYLKKSKVFGDDIIINKIANAGATYLMPHLNNPVSLAMNLFLLRVNTKYSAKYLYYSIKTKEYKLRALASGTSTKTITKQDVKNFRVWVPSISEQQKIASFLSAVDKKIEQLSRKKALLETYKKSVMQKLFLQEIRFRDENGKDFPVWEEKKLKNLTQIFDGTHSTPEYTTQGIPFYSVEHLTANQFEKTKFIAEEVWEKENKRVKLEKNDVLMTRIGDIGTAKLIDWDVKASFYVSLALLKGNENFNSSYLSQYIMSKRFQQELWKRTIHVAFPKKINLGEIGNSTVQLPQKKEQQKIADFLSAIDSKIEAVSQQIEKTQAFKKGLLQQMFV